MSRTDTITDCRPISFPRVSGDEPVILTEAAGVIAFSPRERG